MLYWINGRFCLNAAGWCNSLHVKGDVVQFCVPGAWTTSGIPTVIRSVGKGALQATTMEGIPVFPRLLDLSRVVLVETVIQKQLHVLTSLIGGKGRSGVGDRACANGV